VDGSFIGAGYFGGGRLGDAPASSQDSGLSEVVKRFFSGAHAARYKGFWVALDGEAEVLDHDLSPSALSARMAEQDDVVITLVP